MNNKGFTLMEILAVLLVIAVVTTFAVPVIKSVRKEVQYRQATFAAAKMAEAVRAFYKDSRGYMPSGSVSGTSVLTWNSSDMECENPADTGVPSYSVRPQERQVDIKMLFACGYLSIKDFAYLPYTFTVSASPSSGGALVSASGDTPFTVDAAGAINGGN